MLKSFVSLGIRTHNLVITSHGITTEPRGNIVVVVVVVAVVVGCVAVVDIGVVFVVVVGFNRGRSYVSESVGSISSLGL